MNPHYAQVARRASHRCEYCRAPEAVFNFPFEVEHVLPPGYGGTDEDSNLGLSCRACNLYKGSQIEAQDPQTGKSTPLFHPRRDAWEEHFKVDEQSGIITGLTFVGRATVDALKMNRPAQVAARRHWMLLRLFP